MWYKENPASPEEKKAKIKAYHDECERVEKEKKAEEQARAAALKKRTPEEKAEAKKAAARRAADLKEKKAADKQAAQKQRNEEKAYLAGLTPEERSAYFAKKKADRAAQVEKEFAAYKEQHAKAVAEKGAALSDRYDFGGKMHRFWFNVGQTGFCQAYMRWWRHLSIAHPSLAHWLYQIFYFIVFSEGVTVLQLLIMLFLPYVFASLCSQPFVWPAVSLGIDRKSV